MVDAAGAVVGTMFGGSETPPTKPVATGVPYDLVPANDGLGVQSTVASDRTWMEDMIGPGDAAVTTDYKGPTPAGVSYDYQNGHGADGTTHAAYDISCASGDCVGTPMSVPMAGKVVCSGYGQGTGESLAGCTYSQNTTLPGQAHTIVIDVGTDAVGNRVQLSLNHMGTSAVTPGQMVNVGDPLGTMGDTDAGPHVHAEAWGECPSMGTYVILDPQLVVKGYYKDHPVC
jgi:murein DD-endopeptidase MepM/ murein hydrolase activator NlpD